MCECELRMKILLIFTLCLISDGGDSREVSGNSGGGVLIKCEYHTEYTQNKKYFCKGSPPGCSDQIKTEAKNKCINSGRFSLYDDTKSAEFWVMIRELTVQDTGTYHCGVDISYGTDIYTPVELKVKEEPSAPVTSSKPTQPSSPSSLSSSSSSPPPPPPSSSSSSPPSLSSSPLLLTNNHNSSYTPGPPPAGFPASTVITVSVILLLLLTGIIFLTLTLQKRCKMQAGTAFSGSSSVQDSGNNQGVPLDACEYEEIKDTSKLSAIAGTSTIYSTVQLPIVPSDPSEPLYDNMLHTIPPDQDIYSTAQSPTALSTEESTYTTVSFHSKTTSSNDAMPQIVFKSETTDYALVNRVS